MARKSRSKRKEAKPDPREGPNQSEPSSCLARIVKPISPAAARLVPSLPPPSFLRLHTSRARLRFVATASPTPPQPPIGAPPPAPDPMDVEEETPKPPQPDSAGSEPDDARKTPPPPPPPPPAPVPPPASVPAPAAEANASAALPAPSVAVSPAAAEANGNSDRKKKSVRLLLFPFLQSFGCEPDFLLWFVACGSLLLLTFFFYLFVGWIRRKVEDGEGCKTCSCKKSKCLKL